MKNEAIEMIKTPLSIVRVAAFCLPLALVASCGGDGSSALPGTVITIQVAQTEWDVTNGSASSTQDEPVLISVKTPSGYQLGVTDIYITLDLAPGTFSLGPYMRIFEESSPGSNSYTKEIVAPFTRTQTDASGNKTFLVRMQLGNGGVPGYRGTLYVVSGSDMGTTSFEVSCVDGVAVCP